MMHERESKPSSEATNIEKISDMLNALLDSQFEEIIFLLDVKKHISSSVPRIKQTKELIECMLERRDGLEELNAILLNRMLSKDSKK